MNKKRIFLIIGIILIIIAICILAIFFVKGTKEYGDVYLDEEKFDVAIDNFKDNGIDSQMSVMDELDNKINLSQNIALEKLILNNSVGMYGFKVSSDLESSKIVYTIKNHTKNKIDAFKYRLQLLNSSGEILGMIDLQSKEIPALSKYNVELNINEDIADIYDIIPVTDLDLYGMLNGGEIYEKK